jgi:membrane protein YdbS with pleckstrin-like domain
MALETRAHWLTVAVPFLVLVLAIAAAVAAYTMPESETGLVRFLRIAALAVLVIIALWFGYREVYRRRDIWAVTNFRVIDERGVFTLYTKESPLEKINNISYYQTLPGRILKFGEVEIQTAAEDGATVYRMVTDPKALKNTVARCRDEYSRQTGPRAASPASPAAGE